MMRFDPDHTRAAIYEMLRYPELSFDELREKSALCGFGWRYLLYGEKSFVVGEIETGRHLLCQARVHLESSLALGQKPYLDHEQLRLHCLATCKWLADGTDDLKLLRPIVELNEADFSAKPPRKFELALSLPDYLNASEYEALIRRCELSGMKPAAKLRRTLGEAAICYAIARHRLGLAYTAEEMAAALDGFLERQVPDWLDNGHYPRVILWMKIAFWKPGDDPIATILRCYDYLPGIKRPKYP